MKKEQNLQEPQKQALNIPVENTVLNKPDVSSSAVYPLAFLTKTNKLFMKSKTELSVDGTPRYIPNLNASATYCLQDCIKDYTPIYDKKILKKYM